MFGDVYCACASPDCVRAHNACDPVVRVSALGLGGLAVKGAHALGIIAGPVRVFSDQGHVATYEIVPDRSGRIDARYIGHVTDVGVR